MIGVLSHKGAECGSGALLVCKARRLSLVGLPVGEWTRLSVRASRPNGEGTWAAELPALLPQWAIEKHLLPGAGQAGRTPLAAAVLPSGTVFPGVTASKSQPPVSLPSEHDTAACRRGLLSQSPVPSRSLISDLQISPLSLQNQRYS